ncbi:hypothetical protein C8F01DRAFT_1057892 [Mycena amicta]|nr:hypothetical protein C8F01DRAFT_1057892 [Mycena amicta]
MDRLRESSVREAIHSSGDLYPEPACLPTTRVSVLKELMAWARNVDGDELPMLWLNGPAGAGKSSVSQTFAATCAEEGLFIASFFFRRGHKTRGTWRGLVPTLAYQLALRWPAYRDAVERALGADSLILGSSVPLQFHQLFSEILPDLPPPSQPPILIIDGLDECEDRANQNSILYFLVNAAASRTVNMSLRLFISSTRDANLSQALESPAMRHRCDMLTLEADEESYGDIRRYLEYELHRIDVEFRNRGVRLGDRWLSPATLDELVDKSSGMFIHAVTVIRYLENEFSLPADRLGPVVALDPETTAPMDHLYTQIMSTLPCDPNTPTILFLLLHPQHQVGLQPEDVDLVLNLRHARTRLLLRALHSILVVPELRTPPVVDNFVAPLHASFIDYLWDRRRCQSDAWCITLPSTAQNAALAMAKFLIRPQSSSHVNLRR